MHLNNINFMYPKFQETNKQKSSSVSFKGKTEFLSLSNLSQIPNRTFNGAIIQVGERLYQIWNNSKDVTEINQNIYDILHEINVEKQYTWKVSGDTIFITDKRKGVR